MVVVTGTYHLGLIEPALDSLAKLDNIFGTHCSESEVTYYV